MLILKKFHTKYEPMFIKVVMGTMEKTLIDIGPAVLNGGISTFLAFVLLMTSKSYVFKTFFKIFFLVVFFGLYHGMVFLPVILSLIGPKPYKNETVLKVTPKTGNNSATAWVTNKKEDIEIK